jgi:hypothetical protein
MAERLAAYNFNDLRWDDILDGGIWRLRPGQDFTGPVKTMQRKCFANARNRGGRARTKIEKDGALIVQFWVPERPRSLHAETVIDTTTRTPLVASASGVTPSRARAGVMNGRRS